MTEIFGIPTQALFGQLLIGLINGSFYALLSLGLVASLLVGAIWLRGVRPLPSPLAPQSAG